MNKSKTQVHTCRNLANIADALRHICDFGNDQGTCIFWVSEWYYVQFGFDKDPHNRELPLLFSEAVSNEFLPADLALTEAQAARLLSMGWRAPWRSRLVGPGCLNYSQTWGVAQAGEQPDEELFLQIAHHVVTVFVEVYGASPEAEVKVEFPQGPEVVYGYPHPDE